ncbi:hypothetical protein [uncultured Cohaesibacter sp.]|uniref:hypothetical protein n=1 Tax=uncultured Cohaesibacter sp. TaxID=1002546 RepID=UPI0029318F43|nr:hypothetical protein [uncultured Cohaesibacter sp.]
MIDKKYMVAIVGSTLLVILGLRAGAESTSASEQLQDCLSQSDLACVAELAYRYPSSIDSDIERKKAAISLAYLGKPEKAFELYTDLKWRKTWSLSKLYDIFYALTSSHSDVPESFNAQRSRAKSIRIASAVLVYLIVKNRTDEIDGYMKEIVDANEKLAVLNYAWAIVDRPVALMHPEYAERLSEVIDNQLDGLGQNEISISDLQTPDLLSVSHNNQLIAVANKIDNYDKRKRFIDSLVRYNQRATKEAELFQSIEVLVRHGDKEEAIEKIEAITNVGKPKFYYQSFASFFYARDFYRFWQRKDSVFQDLLAEAVIERIRSWNDPVCKTDVYTGLALFYAYANRKDAALALLDRFKELEPVAYKNLGGESSCQTLGFFSTTIFRFILGADSLIDIEDYLAQFAGKPTQERIALLSEFKSQSFYILTHAVGFSSSQRRERILKLRNDIEAKLLPEDTRGSADVYDIRWPTKSGDWEIVLAEVANAFERLRKGTGQDRPSDEQLSDQLFSKFPSDELIEEGFFWREGRSKH